MVRLLARLSVPMAMLVAVRYAEANVFCMPLDNSACSGQTCVASTASCNSCFDSHTGGTSCGSCSYVHCRCCCKAGTLTSESSDLAPFTEIATAGDASGASKHCAPAPKTVDETLGIRVAIGAFVIRVNPGSPASDAGLALCDLIVSFPGGNLRDSLDNPSFRSNIREAAMLSGAQLDVWKFNASTETYKLTTAQFHIPAKFAAPEGLATTFQAMILDVPEGTVAAEIGIRRWDFIYAVNDEQVANMRNVLELDQKVSDALTHDGKVRLTLGRWKPVASSPKQETELATRDVTFIPRAAGGDSH